MLSSMARAVRAPLVPCPRPARALPASRSCPVRAPLVPCPRPARGLLAASDETCMRYCTQPPVYTTRPISLPPAALQPTRTPQAAGPSCSPNTLEHFKANPWFRTSDFLECILKNKNSIRKTKFKLAFWCRAQTKLKIVAASKIKGILPPLHDKLDNRITCSA